MMDGSGIGGEIQAERAQTSKFWGIGGQQERPPIGTRGVQPRLVEIYPAMNGFIVNVGCKTVVFETRERLISELDRYLKDPNGVSKEYLEKYSGKEVA